MVNLFLFWLFYETVGYLLIRKMPKDRCYMAPALIQAGIGVVQTGIGIAQKIKAAKLAKTLRRPVLKDNPYIDQAYAVTGELAGQGLSDASRNAFITNNDRNISSGIDAVLMAGGSANNIGDIIDAGGNAVRSMALADQEIRMRNQRNFLTALQAKADEDRDQFLVNEMAPYQDQAQLVADLNKQGASSIWKGINTAGSAAMQYFGQQYGEDLGKNASVVPEPPAIQNNDIGIPSAAPVPLASYASPAARLGGPLDLTTAGLLNRYGG